MVAVADLAAIATVTAVATVTTVTVVAAVAEWKAAGVDLEPVAAFPDVAATTVLVVVTV